MESSRLGEVDSLKGQEQKDSNSGKMLKMRKMQ